MGAGKSAGIFQAMVSIPEELEGNRLPENGEAVTLEYTDWGPAGAYYVDSGDAVLRTRTTDQATADAGMATDHAVPGEPLFGSGVTMQLDQRIYTGLTGPTLR